LVQNQTSLTTLSQSVEAVHNIHPVRVHHQRAIDRVVARFRDDPHILALVLAGSVAKGMARDDSDVDFIFVVSAEEYSRRAKQGQLAFVLRDITDYQGGYIDVKIQSTAFLREAAQHGSEPTRNAFVDARCVFARDAQVAGIVSQIPIYQEQERQEKITSFLAQVDMNRHYFFGEAERERDPYLMTRVISDLVLFGGRLLLAHNRMFFPSHKRLLEAVARAPEKPANFLSLAQELLVNPERSVMERFCDAVEQFTDWGVSADLQTRFVEDSELSWLTGKPSLADT
jgi:predicted nucleotidyltransferase